MTSDFLEQATTALAGARVLIGLWLLLWTAEWLAAAGLHADDGPLPWATLARARRGPVVARVRGRMSTRRLRAWLIAQLAVVVLLLATSSVEVVVACLAVLVASVGGLLLLTGEHWASGADKIGTIAMAGTALTGAGILAGDPALALAGVLAVGGQLTICYMVAGLSKLVRGEWRSGAELARVMDTDVWGHAAARALVRHRAVALAATWAVIAGETLFPLALIAPHGWLVAALAAFALFHLLTAIVMGLNTFPWAFAATYPAVLLLGRVARGWIG